MKTQQNHIDLVLKDAVNEVITITLHEYYHQLSRHDWYSSYSDSHSAWKAGEAAVDDLRLIARTHPAFQKLFKEFHDHHFSGAHWKTEKRSKPQLSDENPEAKLTRPVKSQYGVLIQRGEMNSDIWDNTNTSAGTFLIEEVKGIRRKIAVVTDYQLARQIAASATSNTDGGFSDVMISNVNFYSSINDWILS